jgi:hypothetical protein
LSNAKIQGNPSPFNAILQGNPNPPDAKKQGNGAQKRKKASVN